MSWSFTLNGSVQDYKLPLWLIQDGLRGHAAYPGDMQLGLDMARQMNLKSATITGYRTPNPYGGPETVSITVLGFHDAVDMNDLIRAIVTSGPEEGSPGAQTSARGNDQDDHGAERA